MASPVDPAFASSDFPTDTDPFFLAIAGSTQDCIRVLNLRGEVQFMNPRGMALLEIDEWSRKRGSYWPSLWPKASVETVERGVQAALKGEVARFRAYGPTATGKPKWWDNVVSPVRDPHTGELIGLLAVSQDVTAALETESFLDAVLDNVPMMIFVKSAKDGRFQLINREAEAVFGHSRREMLGKTDHDFFPAEQADFFRSRDQAVIASGKVVHIEEEPVTSKDRGVRYFRTKKVATFGPEGPRHLVCVAEDITEMREAAEALKAALARAEAANQAKSEFLANMSHEIRTPLNGVVGVADVLARTALDPRQREMVDLIRTSGQTLARLLSDILDLARIESGQLELTSEPFHLAETVREVVRLQDLGASASEVRLALDIAPAAEGWRLGDPVRLKQLLTNLLSNAVKFTERGEVRLRVDAARDAFRFSVEDTGVGFDPALKEQIFGRFQQADGSITRRYGGSGLGLAICRQLTELMGGELDCDSVVGRGSRFFATLSFPEAEPPVAEPEVGPEVVAATGGVRVLLADDHPTNRKVVEIILAQAGVDLVAVEDGQQALDAFRTGAFDLVLMDMQMPVMDGLTATRLIREHEARTGAARTPLIMLTANTLREHCETSLQAGADRHVSKPVGATELLRTMSELLAEPEAEEEAGAPRDAA